MQQDSRVHSTENHQLLGSALSPSLHLRTETDPASETLRFLVLRIADGGPPAMFRVLAVTATARAESLESWFPPRWATTDVTSVVWWRSAASEERTDSIFRVEQYEKKATSCCSTWSLAGSHSESRTTLFLKHPPPHGPIHNRRSLYGRHEISIH
jgi:hypothetical protein